MIMIDAMQWPWKGKLWAHMIIDVDVKELHEFAQKIGLKKEWYQPKSFPHYDVTGKIYEKALECGAQFTTGKKLVYTAIRVYRKNPIEFAAVNFENKI